MHKQPETLGQTTCAWYINAKRHSGSEKALTTRSGPKGVASLRPFCNQSTRKIYSFSTWLFR